MEIQITYYHQTLYLSQFNSITIHTSESKKKKKRPAQCNHFEFNSGAILQQNIKRKKKAEIMSQCS